MFYNIWENLMFYKESLMFYKNPDFMHPGTWERWKTQQQSDQV